MGVSLIASKLPATIDGLRRSAKRAKRNARKLLPNDNDDFEVACFIGFHHAMIELVESIRILLKNGRAFDAQILLRAEFEHLVVLKTLHDNPAHFDTIRLENTKRMTITLDLAKQGNPYLTSIAAMESFDDSYADWKGFRQELSNNGAAIKTLEDLSIKAGLKDEYNTIYRSLSKFVHPTFSGIIERSLDVKVDHDGFFFNFEKTPRAATFELVADAAISFLARADEMIIEQSGSAS